LPELVFNSLLERWNAFAPIAFPPETRRYAAECLAIGRYHLSSRVVPTKSVGKRIGAVGFVTYTSLNFDRYWMSVIAVLSHFALFAGVGAGTTMGLGQCRPLEEENIPTQQCARE
jgi:CRISPR-associated endoribonuclease Cas6